MGSWEQIQVNAGFIFVETCHEGAVSFASIFSLFPVELSIFQVYSQHHRSDTLRDSIASSRLFSALSPTGRPALGTLGWTCPWCLRAFPALLLFGGTVAAPTFSTSTGPARLTASLWWARTSTSPTHSA